MINPDGIIIGDIHLHERPEFPYVGELSLNTRLLDGLNILDQIIELCKQHTIKWIIFTGDIFELKDRIPNHMLVPFSQKIEKLTKLGISIFILKGNHDFKIDFFPILKAFSNIDFLDKPELQTIKGKQDISFFPIPFYRNQEQFKEKWFELHNSNLHPILVIFHNDLPGALYSNNTKVPGDFDWPFHFDTLYIGGHIHKFQKIKNNVIFIGTPYQIDFSEKNDEKNILLFDSKTVQHSFISLDYPRFVEWNPFDKSSSFLWRPKNKYVRLIGKTEPKNRSLVKDVKENLLSKGAKGVQINIEYVLETGKRIKAEKSDYRGVLSQFIQETITDLDKTELLNTGLKILESVE